MKCLLYKPVVNLTTANLDAGWPKFDVSFSLFRTLLEDGFPVPNIARILGVSVSTVRRRMTTFHLSVCEMYSTISEDDLEKAIGDIQLAHPNWGNRLMYGYLISICKAQGCIDPEGSFTRRLYFLNRRRYSLPGPQWLWHIDGNHKLIRLTICNPFSA